MNNAFSCLGMILDNAFVDLRDCAPCDFILFSSFIVFSLRSLYRRKLRAILRKSSTAKNVTINVSHANDKKGKKNYAYQKFYKQTLHLLQLHLSLRKSQGTRVFNA